MNFNLIYRYLTECYDELGTQYKVPIYCLSYPINIVKEDNGRDSPAEYSEPVDGGQEVILKLRLSSSFADTKLIVYSKDTIGQCKKKLQVCGSHANRVAIDLSPLMFARFDFFYYTFFPLYRLTFSGYMHFSLIEALTSKLSTNLFLYSNFWICHFFHFFIHTNTYIHATMPPICPLDIIHTQPQSQNEHTDTRECRCMLSALVLRWKITWR